MIHVLGDYRLIVILSGIIASLVCGALKTPIAAYIKAKKLSEKETSQKLTVVCTIITAAVSIMGIVFFRCYEAHSVVAPFCTVDLYFEIVASVAFSRIFYSMYEGVGPVSLKKWMHALVHKMFPSLGQAEDVDAAITAAIGMAETVQDFLSTELGLPLTDEQKEKLEQKLK